MTGADRIDLVVACREFWPPCRTNEADNAAPVRGRRDRVGSGNQTRATKLQRIAKLARQAPEMVMTTLAHHIDVALLREAYRRTRKDGATGIDGQTAKDYAADLEANLGDDLAPKKWTPR